jgi:hypothetical protein
MDESDIRTFPEPKSNRLIKVALPATIHKHDRHGALASLDRSKPLLSQTLRKSMKVSTQQSNPLNPMLRWMVFLLVAVTGLFWLSD